MCVRVHRGSTETFLFRSGNRLWKFREGLQQRALQRFGRHLHVKLIHFALTHQPRLYFLLRDGQIRGRNRLIHPSWQRAQARHLIFVILDCSSRRDGHRAEDIQVSTHEVIDAEVRRNDIRIRDLLFELPIEKPVAQAVLLCEGFSRDCPQAAEKFLQ